MNLPEDLHRQLKHWCVDNNTEMGEVIRRLIEYFLSEETKKPESAKHEMRPEARQIHRNEK